MENKNFEQNIEDERTKYWGQKIEKQQKKEKRRPKEMEKDEWEKQKKENRKSKAGNKLDELRKKEG
ncbi:hypothetical protein KKF29_00410 [Patescibacteria group bacterium]|nr:hypothetical protein [Patescibacteria group bacterium]MBU1091536.1 hypothetical protein [Patescibacteria group bacterium]MBU2632912.1 hypothetical protein [Patescibacteria group bacterium]